MKKVLVVAPHADDAEIGCGGYIARCVSDGAEVHVVVATVGAVQFLHLGAPVSIRQRVDEALAASKVLGYSLEFLTEGMDGALHLYPKAEITKRLDRIQEEFCPDEVLIPLPSAHQDHVYCWQVGVAATRPSPAKWNPQLVAAYEYPLSGWGEGADTSSFRGGMYVNVTQYIETKIAALKCYGTQMRDENSLIGVEGTLALARLRGIEAGFQYAELFHVLRQRIA